MSVIILGIDPTNVALAEINGGRRGLVFQGEPSGLISSLDIRLSELFHRDHTVIVACARPGVAAPEVRKTVARIRMVCGLYYRTRLAMQEPGAAWYVCTDGMLQLADLWTLSSEIGDPPVNHVNGAMQHALVALSRYFPDHFAAIKEYARTREAMS